MLIEDGFYEGRIVDYGVMPGRDGKAPRPVVWVEFLKNNAKMKWLGSFAEGMAKDIAMECLAICGLTPDRLFLLAGGKDSGAIEIGKVVDCHVKSRTWEGKTYQDISRIVSKNNMRSDDMMAIDDFSKWVTQQNLKASLAKTIQTKNMPRPAPIRVAAQMPSLDEQRFMSAGEEIPF